tara:strand:- start:1278 stop:1571 length:294 start_codon:yes stop_codon:yes gene_type:complete
MPLHTLSLPPNSELLESCARLISDEDSLLLLGDGIYASVVGSKHLNLLDTINCKIYALKEDCDLAGLENKISKGVAIIDYNGFVSLSAEHEKHIPWD